MLQRPVPLEIVSQPVHEQRKRVWSKAFSERKMVINAMIEQAELGPS